MKRIIFIYLLLMFPGILSAQPKVIDKVVAVIADKAILRSDVETQKLRLEQEGDLPDDVRCYILNELLTQKLMLNQAEIDSIEVMDDEVESELDRRIRYFVSMLGSEAKLEEYYQKSIPEMKEDFRPDVKEQLLAQRMQSEITDKVTISPAEVKKYFKQIPSDSLPYFNAQVQLGEIIIYPKVGKLQKQMALDKITELRNRIIKGEDFGLLAYLYSEDPGSAKQKGELPEFGRDDPYDPVFKGTALKLQTGEVSEVIESAFGYHIIQLIDRKGNRVKVRHILIIPKLSDNDLKAAASLADSVQQLLNNHIISFDVAVKRYSQDDNTKQNMGMIINAQTGDSWFDLDQLGAFDRDLPFIIDTLNKGDYSPAKPYVDASGKNGYRIIYLKGEKAPHKANINTDYSRIQANALEYKKKNAMEAWMNSRIKKTYIKIDPEFDSCDVLKRWNQLP